jgi:hypothetical protein
LNGLKDEAKHEKERTTVRRLSELATSTTTIFNEVRSSGELNAMSSP